MLPLCICKECKMALAQRTKSVVCGLHFFTRFMPAASLMVLCGGVGLFSLHTCFPSCLLTSFPFFPPLLFSNALSTPSYPFDPIFLFPSLNTLHLCGTIPPPIFSLCLIYMEFLYKLIYLILLCLCLIDA